MKWDGADVASHRVLRGWWVAVAALTLAACGTQPLPVGQAPPATAVPAATATPEPTTESTPEPTTAPTPVPPSNDPIESVDTGSTDDEEAFFLTAEAWTDATANLVGLESECGTIHYLSAHPLTTELFVGVAANGMFRLDEETRDWEPLGTGASSDYVDNRLVWIEYEPTDPNRFWQAGIYGEGGVFRTDDGGTTFSQQGDIRHVDYVSTDLTDPDRAVMLAGGHEDRVLYRSSDGGTSWEDIAATLPEAIGFTAYPIVVDASTYVLGTFSSENAGIFRSEDGGSTWASVYSGGISGPPLIDGANIYWLSQQGGGLIVSNDGGETFVRQPTPTGGRPATLSQLQDGRLVTHNDTNALISDDQGQSWSALGPAFPIRPQGIVMSTTETEVYAWTFTCNFDEGGNPVLPNSIVRLDIFD